MLLSTSALALLLLWRRWSHSWGLRLFGLPLLAQELNLFSENAFYYSYYTQVVDAPSLADAVVALRRDDRTEYPVRIDALSRFNLCPELVLGAVYRLLPLALQESCSRFAFYVGVMLAANALGCGVLASTASAAAGGEPACAAASAGLWCALLVVPISRAIGVHVAALRENFALPVLHLQTAALAAALRGGGAPSVLAYGVLTWVALLSWQFSGLACG